MAYFDWNATAPLLPQAREVWLDSVDRYWANPSSAHRPGVQARLALEEGREYLAGRFSVEPEQVIFTSGATEAIDGLMSGIARQAGPDSEIWISSVEHPAVRESANSYWGAERIREIPVSLNGRLDLDWTNDQLSEKKPSLIAVMAANNETGVLHPWKSILRMCQDHGIAYLCDGVQWMGKMPTADWQGCAGVSLSGHKFGGPKGTGCLILGKDWHGLKLQVGGSQEMGSRAGTENVPGILSMVEAFRQRDNLPAPDSESRDKFEAALARAWPGEVFFNGRGSDRLWNTSSVCLPQYRSDRWIAQLDRLGFQVSSGSACSTGKAGPSPVLEAMGLDRDSIQRTVRISSGWETSAGEWEDLLQAILQVRQFLDDREPPDSPGKVIKL